jgi:chromosome segregation ATPase
MKKWLICLFVPTVLMACTYKTDAYKSLEQEKDSVLLEEQKKSAQLNQALAVVNLIEDNFEEILQAENFVTFQTNQEVMVEDSMQRVVDNLDLIKNSLLDNRKKIESLKKDLARSKNSTRDLNSLIDRLNRKVEAHTLAITKLQEELALKNIRIAELDVIVAELNSELTDVKDDVQQKEITIRTQESQLNKVWYVFGTRKELKSQDIFTRNGLLEEGFNKNYFLEADSRKLTEISLYSKKAKLLTNHPASSYVLDKVNDYLVLKISNPTKFWEISKYLVIEVD